MANGKKNYFRHYHGARKDEKIRYLMDSFGKEAYFFYFVMIELCAEKASHELKDSYDFHSSILRQELGVSQRRLNSVLKQMQSRSLLDYTCFENTYSISLPKLSKYMGKYTNKNETKTPNKIKLNKIKSNRVERKEKRQEPLELLDPDSIKIIDYLNKKTSKKFKHNTKHTKELINARLKDGYSVDDFKRVVDVKCQEWLESDMQKYLRPSTLFNANKFEDYLNQQYEINPELELENLILSTFEQGDKDASKTDF